MVKNLAKRAMTAEAEKACYVIDHLVEALGNDPSSSLRRASILVDIDQYPGTTQAGVMERLGIDKSTANREAEWLFNYGCIRRSEARSDGRAVSLEVYGYAKTAMESALEHFKGDHTAMKTFIDRMVKYLKMERPTLRDAKIVFALYSRGKATKNEILNSLYDGPTSTDNRAYNQLVEEGVIGSAG